MRLKALESLARSEERAHAFLLRLSQQRKTRSCARCGSPKSYPLAGKRYRCRRCGYTFHDFTGRWLDALNLRDSQWLWVLKLFELGIGPHRVAAEVGISYPTALKAGQLIRGAIFNDLVMRQSGAAQAMLSAVLANCGVVGARHNSFRGAPAAFGVANRGRSVATTALSEMTPRQLSERGTVVVKRGGALYSDRCEPFDAVIFTGTWDAPPRRRLGKSSIYSDRAEGFWSFLRGHLRALHGVSARRFPFYLIELQFRYNHRGQQVLELLAEYITRVVPKHLPAAVQALPKKNWLPAAPSVAAVGHRPGV